MSAEQYSDDFGGHYAQPTVDILPMPGGKRGKAPEPTESVLAPLEPEPVWEPAPAEAAHAEAAPEWPTPAAPDVTPGLAAPTPDLEATPAPAEEPKKFFGMQVRRGRKKGADEQPPADAGDEAAMPVDLSAFPAPVADVDLAAFPPPGAAVPGYEAVVAPVAAWPTDSSVSVVANAEPSVPAGAYAAPSPYAPVDLFATADGPPAEASDTAPNPWMPVPTTVAEPTAVAAAVAPVAPVAPAAPAVDPDEVRALHALLEASEAGRADAEARASMALAQLQQGQQQLAQLELDAQGQLAAAETKTRKALNDAQDWQIRHREAEGTIAELAVSVASAEQRMAEIRAERDDLLAELEAATAPTVPAPQV